MDAQQHQELSPDAVRSRPDERRAVRRGGRSPDEAHGGARRGRPDADPDHGRGEDGLPRGREHRPAAGELDLVPRHVPEVHRVVGLGAQRDLDGHAALSLHGSGERHRSVPRLRAAHEPLRRQPGQARAADPAEIQLGVRLEPDGALRHWRPGGRLSHEAVVDHPTMTRSMNRPLALAALLCAAPLASCDKNTVQELPLAPVPTARIKFFNFGLNAPAVNFYANGTKMTAIMSISEIESTSGVAYSQAGNGGPYSARSEEHNTEL